MHPTRTCISALLATTLLASPLTAGAVALVNGDFSDTPDLAGWTATGTVVREPTGGFAQLETDTTFQWTLEQGFLVVGQHYRLSFDFAFSTEAAAPPGAGVPDAFTVSITTANGDWLDILAADVAGAVPDPSDGNEAANNAVPIEVGLDPTPTIPDFVGFPGGAAFHGRVSLVLPDLVLGQNATLFFDLFDYADGAATLAAVDNVTLEPADNVPLPPTLALLAAALLAVPLARRRPPVQRASPTDGEPLQTHPLLPPHGRVQHG